MSIPNFTADGILPPIDPSDPVSSARSPYSATITDVILRFATSAARREILAGWLKYRAALHAAGLRTGFQWLDGSFLEDVEVAENRDPADMDCVTFFQLDQGLSQTAIVSAQPDLFTNKLVKTNFKVDAYTVDLRQSAKSLVRNSCYWYSVWSHRRTMAWKGFVQVDLASDLDDVASSLLASNASGDES